MGKLFFFLSRLRSAWWRNFVQMSWNTIRAVISITQVNEVWWNTTKLWFNTTPTEGCVSCNSWVNSFKRTHVRFCFFIPLLVTLTMSFSFFYPWTSPFLTHSSLLLITSSASYFIFPTLPILVSHCLNMQLLWWHFITLESFLLPNTKNLCPLCNI